MKFLDKFKRTVLTLAVCVSGFLGNSVKVSADPAYHPEFNNYAPKTFYDKDGCGGRAVRIPAWGGHPAYVETDAKFVLTDYKDNELNNMPVWCIDPYTYVYRYQKHR